MYRVRVQISGYDKTYSKVCEATRDGDLSRVMLMRIPAGSLERFHKQPYSVAIIDKNKKRRAPKMSKCVQITGNSQRVAVKLKEEIGGFLFEKCITLPKNYYENFRRPPYAVSGVRIK